MEEQQRGNKQKRFDELRRINQIQTRWDQHEALEEKRLEWERRRASTRRHCAQCGCVLYVRGPNDMVANQHDLDDVFVAPHDRVHCFRCHTHKEGRDPPIQWNGVAAMRHQNDDWWRARLIEMSYDTKPLKLRYCVD